MYSYRHEGGTMDGKNIEEQSFLLKNGHSHKFMSPSRTSGHNMAFSSNMDYNGGNWVDETSANNEMPKENACVRGCANCIFPGRTFSEDWEQLADSFIHPLDRQRMSLALFLLFATVSSLSVIELVYQAAITVHVMCNMVFAFCFITMFIFLCTRFCKQRHFLFVRIMTFLSCLTYSALVMPYKLPFAKDSGFFSPGDRMWELLFVILVVYLFIPLPYLLCLLVGILLPVGYATTLVLQWDSFRPLPDIYSISANLVLLAGAGNIIGLVAWCIWNRFTRRLLVHVREYALAGVELEKENEKFDRVISACFPPSIGVSIKADILNGVVDCSAKERIVNYESVTMTLVELVGFDRVLMTTPPRDKGVLVNKLLAKLCELSEGYACACLNSDSSWTVLIVSGIVHSRSDHSRAALHLAFDCLDFVNALSDTCGVPLRLRISVHSGSIACGLVGKHRWVYDAWSHDLVALQRMHESAVVGQVQISRETLAFFGNASDIQLSQEPNVVAAAAVADRFVVRPNRPPRLYGFSDVLSSFPDRHLLAPTQLLIAALDSTSTLNCNQFPLFGQTIVRPSPIQLLINPVRLPDEEAFALHSVRQLQDDCGSQWVVPTIVHSQPRSEMETGATIALSKSGLPKRDVLNPFTMRFRSRALEQEFEDSPSTLFALSLISCLAVHVISTIFHCLVLPKTILFLTLTLFTFINFLTPLFTMVCNKLGCVTTQLQRASRLRLCFSIICLVLAYLTAQVNVLTCSGGMFDAVFMEKNDNNAAVHRQCPVPVYIGAAGLLVICMPMLFTRILALVKVAFSLMVALGFALVIEYTHRSLFVKSSIGGFQVAPTDLSLLVSLAVFVILVYVHGRLLDRLERIALLWQRSCAERHVETSGIAQNCRRLLNNVLPEPALSCLVDSAIPIDSYSENQDNIAVAVLSLENLPQASSLERRLNSSKVLDAFRLLSHLIQQIDELATEARFKDLVKVRSVGSQYIVAVGLYCPDLTASAPETAISQRLSVAIDFVLAVRQMVVMSNSNIGSEITVHSGISIGSVTCGVIACRTVYFDIFSNTVRTALQMAKTCKPEYVQVSETVYTYTRYLYRYYSRKRMSVDPIGEFFAYRLIGTRAMYRNGPLGLGPLIGSGLTRQGSRESGVSLLSQATSVWSQPGGPSRSSFAHQLGMQQQRMVEANATRFVQNGVAAYALSTDDCAALGTDPVVIEQTLNNSMQSEAVGHYASTASNSYAYYAGPAVASSGPYQYASAYVPPFNSGRNINLTQLSAVPEMDTSGIEQASATMASSNSTRCELNLSSQKMENAPPVEEEEDQEAATEREPEQMRGGASENDATWSSDKLFGLVSKPQLANTENRQVHMNGHNNPTIKGIGSTAESGQNSPRSQLSHYDNNNGTMPSANEQEIYMQRRLDIGDVHGNYLTENDQSLLELKAFTMNAVHHDLSPVSARRPQTADASALYSKSTTFSLPASKAKTSSRQSLQNQSVAERYNDEYAQGFLDDDNADIDQRLAALDELDRRIRESVAQLRCVEASDSFAAAEENYTPRSSTNVSQSVSKSEDQSIFLPKQSPMVDSPQVPASLNAIPFIDESMLVQRTPQRNLSGGPLDAKASSQDVRIRNGNVTDNSGQQANPNGSNHILPDLIVPPPMGNSAISLGNDKLRSRSADFLGQTRSVMNTSYSMAPMPSLNGHHGTHF